MQTWQGILVTIAIVLVALVIYDKWVKGKVQKGRRMKITEILVWALTIAVALLVYDRFIKPAGRAVLGEAGSSKAQTIEEILAKEGF